MNFGKGNGALVTGGSQRIGKAMAKALARRGMNVAIHYHNSKDLALKTVEELSQMGVKSAALFADFLKEEETETLIDKAQYELGCTLNVLINNVSIFERDHIQNSGRELWDMHMEVNLRAPFVLTQKFSQIVPPAIKNDQGELISSGCIINLVDQRVLRPTSEFATYTISKMALWDLTQTSAVTLAPDIRVNAIGPGPTLIAKGQSEGHFARQRQNTPLGRGASTNEVISTMEFYLDNPSITGQIVCLDGGKNMVWKCAPTS